jgi:hypothetical protein
MPRMELRIREVDIEVGAKSKGSNGGVAVGLPHRNSSVFNQAHINQWEVKVVKVRRQTHPAQWVGLGTVKKVVEIGEKVKAHGLRSMGLLFLIYEK